MSKLVIVESPAKAKTIKKYLGAGYEVVASNGHVRDLPKSRIGIDVDHGFKPQYVNIDTKGDLIKKLQQKAAESESVYLATDPDREGEAISWHLAQMLALNVESENRVTFNEITKTGVTEGMAAPRKIDIDLVDAQQARRVLDRLVGYKLSPFLWKKVRRGLSAGRVQSVAVKIIVDREREIRAFVPEEYWTIDAKLCKKGDTKAFDSKFYGTATEKIDIHNEKEANEIFDAVKDAEFTVASIKKGVRTRKPAPPFITSTMQQEASRKLGFTAQRTMRAAQTLYEGVDVNELGTTGLITYMRTDSFRISEEARNAAEEYILSAYGEKYLPKKRAYYKSKSSAQDAHEAIRPTIPSLTPDKVKGALTADQYKLYKLIWERFIASLMSPCLQDTVNVDINAGKYLFKSSGYLVKFDGYTVLYEEGKDEEESDQKSLPKLIENELLKLKKITPNQHFTQPPMRYTEATLIKELEEKKIGRPSTYAPIISTVLQREYVIREKGKKTIMPTQLGEIITELMEDNFSNIIDMQFTAKMEDELDRIEAGNVEWVSVLENFYGRFSTTLSKAEKKLDGTKIKVPDVESDVVCDKCGKKMVVKSGRFGKFLACPGYPQCKNTKPIVTEMPGSCPKCGAKILQLKSKSGHKFFGCETGKSCGFMTWDEPTAENCPNCGKTLFKKSGKLYCATENCGFEKEKQRRGRKAKLEEKNEG